MGGKTTKFQYVDNDETVKKVGKGQKQRNYGYGESDAEHLDTFFLFKGQQLSADFVFPFADKIGDDKIACRHNLRKGDAEKRTCH